VKFLSWLKRTIPTVLTALIFSVIIWITAISEADPTSEDTLKNSARITIIGMDPNLLLVNTIPQQLNLTVRAPTSLISRMNMEPDLVAVTLDLSGLGAGKHIVRPQVDIKVSPVEVITTSIKEIEIQLEDIANQVMPISINLTGTLPVSYTFDAPQVNPTEVSITGPRSLVEAISQVAVVVDISNATSDINLQLELSAFDASGSKVTGISLSPKEVDVTIPITQLGGYRNLFVKIVTIGQIANGFYLTGLSASPVTVTVFASNPDLVANMPAYIETTPINLNGAAAPFEIEASLNLPDGVELIGEQSITIQVGIQPIESSINFLNVPVQVINLGATYTATLSPSIVDVYLSGPLYLLEQYSFSDIIINLDLGGRGAGTYQLVPVMELLNEDIKVDAILPGTIEVIIKK